MVGVIANSHCVYHQWPYPCNHDVMVATTIRLAPLPPADFVIWYSHPISKMQSHPFVLQINKCHNIVSYKIQFCHYASQPMLISSILPWLHNGIMAFQITGMLVVCSATKNQSSLCTENLQVIGGFPSQSVGDAESVSMSRHHHAEHELHHDDVIKWKHFPRYWPFVRGIHRSPVNSPHKGQWRGALMFSLICAQINDWVKTREAGDLRRRWVHYDVTVMRWSCPT